MGTTVPESVGRRKALPTSERSSGNPRRNSLRVEVRRQPAAEEREAGAEDQARIDLARRRHDALVEHVPRLVGERLEDALEDLVLGAPVVAGDRRRPSRRSRSSRASARAETGRGTRRGACGARGSRPAGRPWRGAPTGGIGSPSRNAAASVSSNVLPFSSACMRTDDWRVSSRLTTKAGASLTSTPRLPSFFVTSQAVASVTSSVAGARTSSTSGSTATGLKKCMPTTRSGCRSSAAISATDSDEVFVTSRHSSETTRLERGEHLALDARSPRRRPRSRGRSRRRRTCRRRR